jgi:pyridinium-3,5-biscarboxylic acid mononucleotide sulfurtransferase
MTAQHKREKLEQALAAFGRVAVCYSGGVDSSFLVRSACDTLGRECVLALLADTPSMPRDELQSARDLARSLNWSLVEVATCEIDDPVYAANPVDRCYYCKHIIFGSLLAEARARGFDTLLDGSNFDDRDDFRPGHRAVRELGIVSPLMDAGLTKGDIRALSRSLGLPTADKPALACLATRVPVGVPISREVLARIERAEQVLWNAGFHQLRVRDHGAQARLELCEEDFGALADVETRRKIVAGIHSAGYRQVLLDLDPLLRK